MKSSHVRTDEISRVRVSPYDPSNILYVALGTLCIALNTLSLKILSSPNMQHRHKYLNVYFPHLIRNNIVN